MPQQQRDAAAAPRCSSSMRGCQLWQLFTMEDGCFFCSPSWQLFISTARLVARLLLPAHMLLGNGCTSQLGWTRGALQ